MTVISKFYVHNAVTGNTGTLPAFNVSVSAATPTRIDDSGTNRSMNDVIGTSQTSKSDTTTASTSAAGIACIVRFLSDPIAAQTIISQNCTFHGAFSESNLNSDFFPNFVLAVWRPSTGAVVGILSDRGASPAEPGTTETDISMAALSAAVTTADGDVLVLEVWRPTNNQGMATSYTNTVFYDGTTEGSITSAATYLEFPSQGVTMFSGAVATTIPNVTMAPMIGF